jgi:hypothetical protein
MNAWENVDMIAAEALNVLIDELKITARAARDKTADYMIRPNGYAVGDTVRIKTRPAYKAQEFNATGQIVRQEVRQSTRSMSIEKHFDVSVAVTAKEKVLNIDDFVQDVVRPAIVTLAQDAETYVGSKILNASGLYTSDDLLASAADVALARKAANWQQLDPMGRFVLVDDTLEAKLLGQTWFNQSQTRGAPGVSTLQSGNMGTVMGMDWDGTLYFPTSAHTAASGTGATDNGAAVDGVFPNNKIGSTTLTIDTATGGVNAGDRIEVAGVRRPMVVATTNATLTTTIELVDPIAEVIPDNAAITVIGSGSSLTYHGAIFDTDALSVAMPMLDTPSDKPAYSVSYEGFSIRVVQGYDMDTKEETMSLDFLIGAEAYDPRRITLLAEF